MWFRNRRLDTKVGLVITGIVMTVTLALIWLQPFGSLWSFMTALAIAVTAGLLLRGPPKDA